MNKLQASRLLTVAHQLRQKGETRHAHTVWCSIYSIDSGKQNSLTPYEWFDTFGLNNRHL